MAEERASRCGSRPGFTLIELSIVMGVLTVLGALLTPVMTRIIQNERVAMCAKNERQIFAACMSYSADNGGLLFYAPMIGWGTMNAPYPYTVPTLGNINYTQGVIWPYLGPTVASRQKIMNCPSDFEEHPNNQPTVIRNFSYSFNAGLTGFNTQNYPPIFPQPRVSRIICPSHKILIWEEVGPNDGACFCFVSGGDRDDYPSQRHMMWGKWTSDNGSNTAIAGGGFGNQCFADGHVELLAPTTTWNVSYYASLFVSP